MRRHTIATALSEGIQHLVFLKDLVPECLPGTSKESGPRRRTNTDFFFCLSLIPLDIRLLSCGRVHLPGLCFPRQYSPSLRGGAWHSWIVCPATTVLVDSLALQAKGSSRPKVSNLQAKGCSLCGSLLIGLIIYLSHLSLFESAWERVGKIKCPVGRVQGRGQRGGNWDAWFFPEGKVRLAAQEK